MPSASSANIKAALLDFDMTLVDSVPSILRATNLFAADKGRPLVTKEKVLDSIGLPLEDTWVEFWGGYEPQWPAEYYERYREIEAKGFLLFPDTLSTLKALRSASVKTAIVTNRSMAPYAVESAGLDGFIDAVVGADQVVHPKPDPEPILKALSLVGAEPGEAIYLGDSEVDMMAGSGASVRAVGVTTGAVGREVLMEFGAWKVIGSLGELLPLIGLA
ncbi:MAG: HAD-IA family hydrolase [Deltaproteobacteria bacterium]|jgi:HAD superfamily hydrolase (TIGR01509 family)|nr:HAD-IA family hydrolase [Deltaproteobacteria bacterium]